MNEKNHIKEPEKLKGGGNWSGSAFFLVECECSQFLFIYHTHYLDDTLVNKVTFTNNADKFTPTDVLNSSGPNQFVLNEI